MLAFQSELITSRPVFYRIVKAKCGDGSQRVSTWLPLQSLAFPALGQPGCLGRQVDSRQGKENTEKRWGSKQIALLRLRQSTVTWAHGISLPRSLKISPRSMCLWPGCGASNKTTGKLKSRINGPTDAHMCFEAYQLAEHNVTAVV